jgi:DNA-binding IclR family transcriptional regulator
MVDATSGLALMSGMSDREIDKICRYTNYYELERRPDFYGHAERRRVSTADVMNEIQWIRRVGYSHRPNQPTPELASIAMPLGSKTHGIPLALGVGGMNDRINQKKHFILQTLRDLIAAFHAEDEADSHASEDGMAWHDRVETATVL